LKFLDRPLLRGLVDHRIGDVHYKIRPFPSADDLGDTVFGSKGVVCFHAMAGPAQMDHLTDFKEHDQVRPADDGVIHLKDLVACFAWFKLADLIPTVDGGDQGGLALTKGLLPDGLG
jgi:hypothetical protein